MKLEKLTSKAFIYLLIIFCFSLYVFRVLYTNQFFFGFLIWNLFLAYIPYLISFKVNCISNIKSYMLIAIWLFFLPNAPYIITDFVHLKNDSSNLFWLDLFLIFSFANTGLLLGILSTQNIYKVISSTWNKKIASLAILGVSLLCGFGIYLGRFLRFNSWNILNTPLSILKQSFYSFKDSKTWFVTFGFGSFLWILFLIYNKLIEERFSK